MEYATIEFVKEKAPKILVPTVLGHSIHETVHLSYLLVSSIQGTDLNETWKTLKDQQEVDVVNQIAEHIHSLAQLKREKRQSADNKWIKESFLSLQPGLGIEASPEDDLLGELLNPDEGQEYEKIWGA